MQAVLPATCFQLLGLPQETWHSIPRKDVQQDLLQAAAKPQLSPALTAAAGVQSSTGRCHTSTALVVQPIQEQCSLFYGQTNPQGQPVLVHAQSPTSQHAPNANASSQSSLSQQSVSGGKPELGAMDICVGDAVDLAVQVHSSLPEAVSLTNLSLTLGLLQEVTVAHSPKSASSGRTDFSRTNSSLRRQTAATSDSPTATGTAQTQSGDLASAVTAAAAGQDADVHTQWQETEELVCPLAQASTSGHEDTFGSNTEPHEPNTMRVTAGAAILQPGVQQLTFQACPLKRGLYSLKHMTASLQQLDLHIPALPRQGPHQLDPHQQTAHQHVATHPLLPHPADTTFQALGSVLSTGLTHQQTVVLNVHSCRQRLAVSAAAVKGGLVAGQPQWLGISVIPMHDALHEACMHVGLPSQSQHGNAAGGNSLAASLGSRSSNASSANRSLEDSVAAVHALEFLHPDRAIAAPLHANAIAVCPQPNISGQNATASAPSHNQSGHAKPIQPQFTPMPEEVTDGTMSQADAEVDENVSDSRDMSGEASTSGRTEGSSWVSLEHNHGPNMPRWAATQPSLLWVWVQPGMPTGRYMQHQSYLTFI